MMTRTTAVYSTLVSLFTFLGCSSFAFAADLAKIFSIEGALERKVSGAATWEPVVVGAGVGPGDAIRTSKGSRAAIRLESGVLLRLNGDSSLVLGAGNESLSVESGELYLLSRQPSSVPQISTPLVSAAIRGTEIVVRVTSSLVTFSVLEGALEAKNTLGAVLVNSGEEAVTAPNTAPVKRIMVSPDDAVQWAVSYPVDAAVSELGDGSVAPATELKEAALLLGRGQVDAATKVLDSAEAELARSPNRKLLAVARSQRAMINIVNNRKDLAREILRQAKVDAPDSISLHLASSYLAQATFNLRDAERESGAAVRKSPSSPAARLRHAELLMGLGEYDEARDDVREAKKLAGETEAVLLLEGFLALIAREPQQAVELFDEVLAREPASSLGFFGRGLGTIQLGRLPEGRVDLERAVALDPRVSVYRSYLGKAYYEEDRYGLADRELSRAEGLDLRDPTPHLYRAFNKLASYRPVEALGDLERSISLNDNRAVYRSSLALDDDEAVKSAGLAETFLRLGFFEVSRIESYKSLARDYGNYGAHRLLAGSTFVVPGRSLVFARETNIARLLSPVSFNAVRPSTVSDPGSNEYSALFERPTDRTLIEGFGRTPNHVVDAVAAQSGSTGNLSYSLEHRSTWQNDLGANNDRREHNPSIFLAYRADNKNTLQLFGAAAIFDRGLGSIPFDRTLNDPDSASETEAYVGRLGWRHEFTSQVKLIAQASTFKTNIQRRDNGQARNEALRSVGGDQLTDNQLFSESFDIRTFENTRGYRGSAQVIGDSEFVSAILGTEYMESTSTRRESSLFSVDPTIDPFVSRGTGSDDAQNAFLYSTWHLGKSLDFTAGVDFARIELPVSVENPPYTRGSFERDRVLPKLGLVFAPLEYVTLRTALFQTLGGSPTSNLDSLEPSFVAGFEQALDDSFGGSTGKHAAGGLDFKVPGLAYTGVEFTRSKFDSPVRSVTTTLDIDTDNNFLGGSESSNQSFGSSDSDRLRLYYYQVLTSKLVSGITYTRRQDDVDFQSTQTDTRRIAGSLSWFSPWGYVLFSTVTWRNQKLGGFGEQFDGARKFATVDAGASYLLPNRHGSITVGVQNLLNKDFYYETFGNDIQPYPEINGFVKFSVNF